MMLRLMICHGCRYVLRSFQVTDNGTISSTQNCNRPVGGNRSSHEMADVPNHENPGVPVNAWTVRKFIQKIRATGSIHKKQRSGSLSTVQHDPQISMGC